MGSVDVGIGHDDDLVVSQFLDVEFAADVAAERGDHVLDLVRTQDSVEPCLLNIQDLTSERQNGLSRTVPSLLCTSACGVTLYEEDL